MLGLEKWRDCRPKNPSAVFAEFAVGGCDWDCPPGLPGLQVLLAKNAKISGVAEGAQIANFADRKCQDCDGGCRQSLLRVLRLPRLPRLSLWQGCPNRRQCGLRMVSLSIGPRFKKVPRLPADIAETAENAGIARTQILPRLPRSPRVSPEIAGITNIGGQEGEIACWGCKKWRDCRRGWPGLKRLPPNISEIAGVTESAEIAELAVRVFPYCDGDCRPGMLRLPRLPTMAKIPRSAECRPRLKELPILLATGMGDCMLRLKILKRLPVTAAGTAEIAAQTYRDCLGCWECRNYRNFSPILPAEVATKIAGRHGRQCRGCWDCRECRYWQDGRDCRPRLPGLPILPAENGWLHAEIEKVDEVAGGDRRDCRDCRPEVSRLAGLLRVPNSSPRLPRLRRRLPAEIMTEVAGRQSQVYRYRR